MDWLHPIDPSELNPIPQDWFVRPPDFVGVASRNSGTSWWYQNLIEHPSVVPNRLKRKELNFFNHFGYKGIDAAAANQYLSAFASPKGCLCGEWSPSYLNFPLAVDYLAQAAPDTKILAVVRNPVDIVLSAWNRQGMIREQRMDLQGDRLYVYRNFSMFPNVFLSANLYKPLKRLLKFFHRSKVLLIQYEKCMIDPEGEIRKVFRFLNIDEHFPPRGILTPGDHETNSAFPHDERTRQRIAEYFFNDVAAFHRLFTDIEISLWRDFGVANG